MLCIFKCYAILTFAIVLLSCPIQLFAVPWQESKESTEATAKQEASANKSETGTWVFKGRITGVRKDARSQISNLFIKRCDATGHWVDGLSVSEREDLEVQLEISRVDQATAESIWNRMTKQHPVAFAVIANSASDKELG